MPRKCLLNSTPPTLCLSYNGRRDSIKEGTVDAGIIYATDAKSANLQVVDLATKDMCKQVIYPAAVLKITKNEVETKKFLDYLKSSEAMKVFESVGFAKAN